LITITLIPVLAKLFELVILEICSNYLCTDDDIIILSVSVCGLQHILNCCYDVSCELLLSFNCSKSCCFVVGNGKGHRHISPALHLGTNRILWSQTVKYLSMQFNTGRTFVVNTNIVKQKLFVACNSVLG